MLQVADLDFSQELDREAMKSLSGGWSVSLFGAKVYDSSWRRSDFSGALDDAATTTAYNWFYS